MSKRDKIKVIFQKSYEHIACHVLSLQSQSATMKLRSSSALQARAFHEHVRA